MTDASAETRYRTADVPVRGGDLRVGVWDPVSPSAGGGAAPTVVAIHGVTASHRSWAAVAARLTGYRVLAPDLRGRGRSRGLPAPYGMAGHADDIAALLDFFGIERAIVVGHSMGGFVAAAMQYRYPERVRSLVLVDGGLPLPQPAGVSPEELTTARLGLAKQRLSMTFPDRESYRRLWREHPAFAGTWTAAVADYVDYDLVGEAPNLRASTPYEAMAQDSADLQNSADWLIPTLQQLPASTRFLRAERGMADEPVGLYAPDWAAQWQAQLPAVAARDVLGVNHYTILFADDGVAAVVDAVQAAAE
jgi:lipase